MWPSSARIFLNFRPHIVHSTGRRASAGVIVGELDDLSLSLEALFVNTLFRREPDILGVGGDIFSFFFQSSSYNDVDPIRFRSSNFLK